MKDLSIAIKPISKWSRLEDRLFFWMKYYDNAYQLLDYEEYLDDEVIDDNLRLDAFFIYYNDKRDKEKEDRIKQDKEYNRKKSTSNKNGEMIDLNDIDVKSKIGR